MEGGGKMTDTPWQADGGGIGRRQLLGLGGAVALGTVGGVLQFGSESRPSPREAAVAYVSALDAGDRQRANELIAANGELEPWTAEAFEWVRAFDVALVGFRVVTRTPRSTVADLGVSISGNERRLRYRFRKLEDAWSVWAAPDGLRSGPEASDPVAPRSSAEAYVAAIDAGDRRRANELVADDGALEPWSEREFEWVPAFDIQYAGAEIETRTGDSATASIDLVISGTRERLRYRLREVDDEWRLWAALDGLRSAALGPSTPRAVATAYVSALDAGDRQRANELIAPDGPLDPWSEREFEWVPAFDVGLVRFEPLERRDRQVVADLTMTVGGNEGAVRYTFRRADPTGWRVWEALDGLRRRT
jgi:hypothetical protein